MTRSSSPRATSVVEKLETDSLHTALSSAETVRKFAAEYEDILNEFVGEPTEEQLLRASDLGRRAMDEGVGLLDITTVHTNAIGALLEDFPGADHRGMAVQAEQVLLECLSVYEMNARGFLDKLEEAARKSEQDVKAIFASAQDGVLMFDEAGAPVDFNNSFANMLGYTRAELKELIDHNESPGGFTGIEKKAFEQLLENGYFDEYEAVMRRRDGFQLVVTLSGALVGSRHEGSSWRGFAFVKDITERKRAEDALRSSEEKFRTLYESSIDGIAGFDMDGYLIDANEAYLHMLGYTLEEARRYTYGELTPDKWHEMEENLIEKQVQALGYSELYEKEYTRKDGSVFPVSVRRWLVWDENGEPISIWAIVRDVTERKRNEQELERINAELDGFAHSVSHDLRGPLSAIVLAAELLRDAAVEDDLEALRQEARDAERTIRRSANRSYELIDDLLALAESGQQPAAPVEVDIANLVDTIRQEHAREMEDRRASLEVSEDLGVVVASQTHMYQLFSNLIMNAISHNDSPTPIVKVMYMGKSTTDRHQYSVCDNGPGISEEDFENIFKPFFKKGGSSRTGVGLAIVEKVTGVYGGDIRSYNDNGACFEFTLKDWDLLDS